MSEKRFKSTIDEETMSIMPYLVSDKEEECFYNLEGCVDLLNEQQSTIQRFEEYVFSDERIICYTCLFCQEKDIYEVKCEIKGSVDVHGKCQYYEKKGGDGV